MAAPVPPAIVSAPSPPSPTLPIFISTSTLRSILTHKNLISHLQSTLPAAARSLATPLRHSHSTSHNSSLLLMPSYSTSPTLPFVGVKIVTHHPLNFPSINASYVLSSSESGQTLALIDANDLTLYRTASISGLASLYLSRPDSRVLVMVGAGFLAPHLIRAHLCSRPGLKHVLIWNRSAKKAELLASRLKGEDGFEGVAVESCSGSLDEIVGLGDIVSCATNSSEALVKGERLKEGTHLDLVGSFKETMKECDDEAIRRGRVYVDNHDACEEAGELVGAFKRGVITRGDICGSLVELITGKKGGRRGEKDITIFKSVGSGVVDLLTAQLLYETCLKKATQNEGS